MKLNIKKNILIILSSLAIICGITYFCLTNINFDDDLDYEKIVEVEKNKSDELLMSEFDDVSEDSLNSILSFLNSYFNDMNKSKDDLDVKEFTSLYFSKEFSSEINVKDVLDTLDEYRKVNKDYKFNYEIMYIKEDKIYGGYYIGISEWSEFKLENGNIEKSNPYGGVYILDEINGKLVISNIIDDDLPLSEQITEEDLKNLKENK